MSARSIIGNTMNKRIHGRDRADKFLASGMRASKKTRVVMKSNLGITEVRIARIAPSKQPAPRPKGIEKSEYLRSKQQAREKLRSEEGYALSVRRMVEPESVFGQMKNNRGFRRFLLRGLSKVSLEVGWLSLAPNLLKWAVMKQKGRVGEAV